MLLQSFRHLTVGLESDFASESEDKFERIPEKNSKNEINEPMNIDFNSS